MAIRSGELIRGVVLIIVSLALVATPAAGAQKVVDTKIVNVFFPVEAIFTLPSTLCGVAGPFTGEYLINEWKFTQWDDGHFVFNTSNSVTLFDSAGNLIMRDRYAGHQASGTAELPLSVTTNLVSHCTPNSLDPGKFYEFHITFTVGEDGILRQIHGEVCDPTAYPFC